MTNRIWVYDDKFFKELEYSNLEQRKEFEFYRSLYENEFPVPNLLFLGKITYDRVLVILEYCENYHLFPMTQDPEKIIDSLWFYRKFNSDYLTSKLLYSDYFTSKLLYHNWLLEFPKDTFRLISAINQILNINKWKVLKLVLRIIWVQLVFYIKINKSSYILSKYSLVNRDMICCNGFIYHVDFESMILRPDGMHVIDLSLENHWNITLTIKSLHYYGIDRLTTLYCMSVWVIKRLYYHRLLTEIEINTFMTLFESE